MNFKERKNQKLIFKISFFKKIVLKNQSINTKNYKNVKK